MEEVNVFESIMNGLSESLEYAKGKPNKARKISITANRSASLIQRKRFTSYTGIGI